MTIRTSAGGAAAAGGMDFQHRVSAWVAVHILAERDAASSWDLPAGATLEWFRCETGQPVDDLMVGTSNDGLVFVQIKRTLRLSQTVDSYLASALDQLVRQFLACRGKTTKKQLWDRPLDPLRDRLVLVTGLTSSTPIRLHLPGVLRSLRGLIPHRSINDVAANGSERQALSVVLEHLRRSWRKTLGADPSEDELRQLLSLLHVKVLDLDSGGDQERETSTLLRTAVLQDPVQADMAWAKLISLCSCFAAERSGADRLQLQQELLAAGINLKGPRSYQNDIERLSEYSAMPLQALAQLAHIQVGSTSIKIHRLCTEALRRAVEKNSILVVGELGAGKSGALHDFVEAIKEDGGDYVLLAVDRIAARSLGELREELGLEHELTQVLDNWPGTRPEFLVIDALDAARGDPSGTMIRDLIRVVVEKSSRWRVVASIRKFDLRYGVKIKELFAGEPPTEFRDAEFSYVRHLNVPVLSDDELGQIGTQSLELQGLVSAAPEELRDLLRVPFNLRLMAELLGVGVMPDQLTPIRTQLELLNRYWLHRVVRSDRQGDAREAVLRTACEKMVEMRTLRVDRWAVIKPENCAYLDDLLSTQVLIEWQPSLDAPPDRYVLAFSHHVLFDYAVARLLLRGTTEAPVLLLVSDPELVIVVRPSLLFHFRHLWSVREQFWDLVFRVIRADEIPDIGKLIGPSVAAELARTVLDLEPLCLALENHRAENQRAAEKVLGHIVGTLLAGPLGEVQLTGFGAGPWCGLLELVSQNLRTSVAYAVRPLLVTLCEQIDTFSPEQLLAAGKAARRLLEFAWAHTPRDHYLVTHALQCVCRTYESDPTASVALIRRSQESPHLSQYGFEEMQWLAREVGRLIRLDTELVEEIYCVAFNYKETSNEPTPMGQSRILPLISNRRQDYEMALYELAEVFPKFLKQSPQNETRALI